MKHAVMLLIQDREGRFLFVKRQKSRPAGGYWCPVSGKVEPGETQAQTVVREALEEVGLTVVPVAKLGEMPCSTGEYLLSWWQTRVVGGTAMVLATDEIEALRWVAADDFATLNPAFQEDLDFIRRSSG